MADTFSPPAGARAAARRALKFKEEGKAKGAGTAVGWTRANQLASGESVSLDTVKRMYSYFSRHEVDKKGKDWGNQANPSNGYIMWLAWGGDAGFSWSRRIVNAQKDAEIFGDMFSFNKKSPCWEGYVQRGMKPGNNGQMVPNCVPVEKTQTVFGVDHTVSSPVEFNCCEDK